MQRKLNSKRLLFVICAVAVAAFVVGIVGCAPKANPGNPTPQATKAEVTPEPDMFGVVEADQWKDIHPPSVCFLSGKRGQHSVLG